jgi:hypothetical protein
MDDEVKSKLIELVKNEPCLYDLNHPDYKNVLVKRNVWAKFDEELLVAGM